MKNGGKRPGAGRPPGAVNKSTADIKAAFQKHGPALVKALIGLTKSKDERVKLGALQACLDRGWGKPTQAVEVAEKPADGAGPPPKSQWAAVRAKIEAAQKQVGGERPEAGNGADGNVPTTDTRH